MNSILQSSFAKYFHEAITNPSAIHEDVLLALIDKYPYVQSLRFAYERKQFLATEKVNNMSSTLLYASSPNWLYEFIHAAVEPKKFEKEDVDSEKEATVNEIDQLIHASVSSGDYFNVHQKEEDVLDEVEDVGETDVIEPEKEEIFSTDTGVISSAKSNEYDDVSVYDDDSMPYSFLWWLHKTRLEYADTYQPFVKLKRPVTEVKQEDMDRIHQQIDHQVLDQQIRENIFHLQSPEDKLSMEVKNTIPFAVPHKSDEIIEKFILSDPQIKPLGPDKINTENKARLSSQEDYELVTETLAKIYAEQGLYPKAIEVYKKLVLKYPEKNAYFAVEIKELENKLN